MGDEDKHRSSSHISGGERDRERGWGGSGEVAIGNISMNERVN